MLIYYLLIRTLITSSLVKWVECSPMVRENWVQFPGCVIPKTLKMVLDTSRDELIRDVLLWIPTHGRAKAGRPARTYIQQLCEDTGCCPEDLPRAMNDREEWRERVRDIRATSARWWWWWWSKVKWSNPEKGVAPSPTPQCSSCWKGCLLVTRDYGHQLYFLLSMLNSSTWNHFTVSKNLRSGSFKNNITYKLFAYKSYIFVCINRIWHWITHKGWYAIKHN